MDNRTGLIPKRSFGKIRYNKINRLSIYMMRSLERYKKEEVHTRHIKISTFATDKGGVILEGELVDDRLKPGFRGINGQRKQCTT